MALELNVASPNLSADPRSRSIIEQLQAVEEPLGIIGGVVYYDYPLFRDADDILYRSKVLFASKSHGLALFHASDLTDRTVTQEEVEDIDEQLAQLHSLIYGRLLKSRILRRSKRELIFEPLTVIVLADVTGRERISSDNLESELVHSPQALEELLGEAALPTPLSEEAWQELRAVLEGSKALARPKDREIPAEFPNGKAAVLRRLEGEIATFDAEQRRAAISIVNGPQRIRGLAGSGKTIVLAMKAAHIHLSNPDATILVTFHTKSLYDFIKRLITRFYRQFNDRDPDFEERVHVLHSWGGRNAPGAYFNASVDAGVPPIAFAEAQGHGVAPFEYVCRELLKTGRVRQRYDYVLVDEAQDLPESFFRLAFQLTRGGPYDRNVVWAYDELQNIMSVRTPDVRHAFGTYAGGEPLVDLDRAGQASGQPEAHDIVLHKCYRNPREVLVCAHALGFGIYTKAPVQMLENKGHWEDVGYVVEQGNCEPGEFTVITRPKENSPLTISDTQSVGEIISYYEARDFYDEVSWIVRSIRDLLAEGLRPDDILVIALDDRHARGYFNAITEGLNEFTLVANNVLAGAFGSAQFAVDREVTLSTVYRAKGNEAPVVFVLGIDALISERNLRKGRNKIFTAFTRAKGWLRISGIGDNARFFFNELDTAIANSPELRFIYPDPDAVERIQRDLTDKAIRLGKLRDRAERLRTELSLTDEEWADFVEGLRKE